MESKEEDPSKHFSTDITASQKETNNSKSLQMEAEMKKMSDEFNAQRAKLKELYLQKEADCQKLQKELNQSIVNRKEVEEQNIRAHQEIQTLQILVQETCDESSRSFTEYKRLSGENENLRQQLLELKASAAVVQQHPDIPVSLGPMINHVKKIAKKLGGADSPSTSDINLEGDMRKAQEDAEVLRSLVLPLEEEIKSLKEKLRSVHTELENTRKTDSTPSATPESALLGMLAASSTPSNSVSACDMCRDYENRLVGAQKALDDESLKCQNLVKHVERMREDLLKESSLRHDLETQWQEKREEHKNEVLRLKESMEKTGIEMKMLKRKYDELQTYIEVELQKLSEDREQVHHHLKVLQNDNDMLSGKYLTHSQYLQEQVINLPDNVEELHEMVLSLQENLILAKVGCEHGEDKYKSFAEEAALLREQMLSQERGHAYSEREFQQRIGALEEKLRLHHDQFQKLAGQRDELKRRDIELKKENSNLRMQLIELTEAKEKTDKLVHELRLKEHTLQQDLSTSEAVQQDFVRLSQNLQIQLEKFRSADMAVRWQFEDDVSHCSNCKKEFTVTRRKQHCRHCGTIYCPSCLKTVKSGVKQKPAEVCDVCYFLLVQNTSLNQWVTSAAE